MSNVGSDRTSLNISSNSAAGSNASDPTRSNVAKKGKRNKSWSPQRVSEPGSRDNPLPPSFLGEITRIYTKTGELRAFLDSSSFWRVQRGSITTAPTGVELCEHLNQGRLIGPLKDGTKYFEEKFYPAEYPLPEWFFIRQRRSGDYPKHIAFHLMKDEHNNLKVISTKHAHCECSATTYNVTCNVCGAGYGDNANRLYFNEGKQGHPSFPIISFDTMVNQSVTSMTGQSQSAESLVPRTVENGTINDLENNDDDYAFDISGRKLHVDDDAASYRRGMRSRVFFVFGNKNQKKL